MTATLVLEKEIELRRGYSIVIEDATVLGGKQVAIDPGPAGAEVVPLDSVHMGKMFVSPLIGLGEVVNENRARIDTILANLDAIVGGVRAGEGALGRVLADPELALRFSEGVTRFAEVMDNATLTDNTGRKADFRQVILIMTSNAGSREMSQATIGFAGDHAKDTKARGKQAIERFFTPEFRNRLDAIVTFKPLTPEVMEQIEGILGNKP